MSEAKRIGREYWFLLEREHSKSYLDHIPYLFRIPRFLAAPTDKVVHKIVTRLRIAAGHEMLPKFSLDNAVAIGYATSGPSFDSKDRASQTKVCAADPNDLREELAWLGACRATGEV